VMSTALSLSNKVASFARCLPGVMFTGDRSSGKNVALNRVLKYFHDALQNRQE
jgi:hypothetical protein